MENSNKIIIGNSDYSREEMEKEPYGWGVPASSYLETIKSYEEKGYKVTFNTSLLRRIFCMGKYQVVATKTTL